MFQLKKSVAALGLGAALFAGVSTNAQALAIVGLFNIGLGGVTISANEIDWSAANPGNTGTKTYGEYFVSNLVGSRSGVFLDPAFNAVTTGSIQDLSQNGADLNYFGLGSGPAVANFMTLNAKNTWQFNLDFLGEGSLAGTPFSLTETTDIVNGQQVTNVSVTLSASGLACEQAAPNSNKICLLSDPDTTRWTGIWSAQYTNTTIAAILAKIQTGGTLDENTWSATVEAKAIPVSEPGSLALVGLALAAVGGFARRRAKATK